MMLNRQIGWKRSMKPVVFQRPNMEAYWSILNKIGHQFGCDCRQGEAKMLVAESQRDIVILRQRSSRHGLPADAHPTCRVSRFIALGRGLGPPSQTKAKPAAARKPPTTGIAA